MALGGVRGSAPEKVGARGSAPEKMAGAGAGRHYPVTKPAPLLEFLRTAMPDTAASALKKRLQHGCIWVNGVRETRFDRALVSGDDVAVMSEREARFGFSHPKLRLLFEDGHILVVDKASGLHSVDSTHGGVENACSILEEYVRRRDASKRIYVVHRLDRDTSGVMIFAKSREAQNRLVADWNDRVLERTYIAVAEGRVEPASGTIDTYLYEDSRKVVHSTDDPRRGLRAITHYRVLSHTTMATEPNALCDAAMADYTVLRLDLDTGRTNQIRVHLASLGHPVAGDAKYGAKTDPFQRLALHAQTICFRHPTTQKVMRFAVMAPAEFGEVVNSE